jgi:hypothetical protein
VECLCGKAEFDELYEASESLSSIYDIQRYLLLLHELRVGTVVDYILPKHRLCQAIVDLLGTDMAMLSVQDEVIALGANIDRSPLAEKNKCEAVTVLQCISNAPSPIEV